MNCGENEDKPLERLLWLAFGGVMKTYYAYRKYLKEVPFSHLNSLSGFEESPDKVLLTTDYVKTLRR